MTQLERVVAAVQEVLDRDLLGAYLFGSAVVGGLKPRSDLDVFVVTARATTPEQKRCLVQYLLDISGGGPRPVELTIVVGPEIRPWRHPPRMDFQYGEWLRDDFERGNFEPWPATNPDLASLVTMVLLADRPLLGPPPAELLDPVPPAEHAEAMVAGIEPLLEELDSDTRNVVLTLARIWSTLATGTIRSKDEAAEWALARLPGEHRAPLARARAIYLGEEPERWDDARAAVRDHAAYVVAEIERVRRAPGAGDRRIEA